MKITYQDQKNMLLHFLWIQDLQNYIFPFLSQNHIHILSLFLITVKDFIQFIITHYLFKLFLISVKDFIQFIITHYLFKFIITHYLFKLFLITVKDFIQFFITHFLFKLLKNFILS